MERKRRILTEWIPGHAQQSERPTEEWICPDCDYFEEADEADGK